MDTGREKTETTGHHEIARNMKQIGCTSMYVYMRFGMTPVATGGMYEAGCTKRVVLVVVYEAACSDLHRSDLYRETQRTVREKVRDRPEKGASTVVSQSSSGVEVSTGGHQPNQRPNQVSTYKLPPSACCQGVNVVPEKVNGDDSHLQQLLLYSNVLNDY